MEAACSSEASLFASKTAKCHNSEAINLNNQCYRNLKANELVIMKRASGYRKQDEDETFYFMFLNFFLYINLPILPTF
jgi:hypothetical protein